jgi:hypothetical protein
MDLVERVARAIADGVTSAAPDIANQTDTHWTSWMAEAVAAIEATGVRELAEALAWYADEKNWNTDWNENNPAYGDRGNRAREALAKHGGVK